MRPRSALFIQFALVAHLLLIGQCTPYVQGEPFEPVETSTDFVGISTDGASDQEPSTSSTGSNGNGSADAPTDQDGDTYCPDTSSSQGDDPGKTFEGTWGMLLTCSILQTGVPIVGAQAAVARSWFVVEMKSDGEGTVTAYEDLCHVTHKLETWMNKSIVPKRFSEHAYTMERHVTLTSDEPGTPWISDVVWDVRGANLCDDYIDAPLPPNGSAGPNDAIPCDEAPCGSHCDQDEDGHPGVTTILRGVVNCSVYGTQRWYSKIEGTVIDKDTIAGDVTENFSWQTALSASKLVCQTGNPGTSPVLDKCPETFYFKMIRLPDGATCDDVMAKTDCDEDQDRCDANENQPLDPRCDEPASCK